MLVVAQRPAGNGVGHKRPRSAAVAKKGARLERLVPWRIVHILTARTREACECNDERTLRPTCPTTPKAQRPTPKPQCSRRPRLGVGSRELGVDVQQQPTVQLLTLPPAAGSRETSRL